MSTINNVKLSTLTESPLHPFQLHFTQLKTRRTWDLINAQDTVQVVIFNIAQDSLVLVRRFEPAVYLLSIPKNDQKPIVDMNKYPKDLGVVLDLCGTLVNQKECMIELAISTILQGTGYKVPKASLQFISSYKSDVGPKCAENTVFYCEVNDEMKVCEGGRIGERFVEPIHLKVKEMMEYIGKSFPEMRSPPSFLHSMLWFINEKCKR